MQERQAGPYEAALRKFVDGSEASVLAVPEWLLHCLVEECGLPVSVPYTAGWFDDMILAVDLGDLVVRTPWSLRSDGLERITAHHTVSAPPIRSWCCKLE